MARGLRQVCPVCDKLRDAGLEGFANFGLEHVEKPGAVRFAERFAAALTKRVGGAQIGHQIAGRKADADIGLGENLAVMLDDLRTCGDAFGCQGDVAGYNHVAFDGAFGDPHIGDIRAVGHDDGFDQRMRVGADAAV